MSGQPLLRAAQATLALLALFAIGGPTAAGPRPGQDHSQVPPVPAKKDPKTGYIVGGKNPTALVRKLTEIAGQPIAALERAMRPGKVSTAGFLGKDEKLLDVLAADNRFVVDGGLTHQELARHLRFLGALAARDATAAPKEIRYHGRRFRLKAQLFRGFVGSPFEDGTRTNCEATVWNLDNGKKLTYSLLVPEMIERYGFYEGHGTRFRVEPRTVLEVLDFLKTKGR